MESKAKAAPSKGLHRSCWIRPGSDLIVAATLVSVSHQEAKIAVTAPIDLPTHFDLLLTRDGKVGRRVEVLWKSGNELGLRFVGRTIPPLSEAEREPEDEAPPISELVEI
jgi:hypothetical protein